MNTEVEQRKALENIKISFHDIDDIDIGLSGISLNLAFNMYNPNDVTATLDRANYDIWINGKRVGNGVIQERVDIPSGTSRIVSTDFDANYSGVSKSVLSVLLEKQITFRVAGTAHYDTVLGTLDIPFDVTKYQSLDDSSNNNVVKNTNENSVKSGKIPTEFHVIVEPSTNVKSGDVVCVTVVLLDSDNKVVTSVPVQTTFGTYLDDSLYRESNRESITDRSGFVVNDSCERVSKNEFHNNIHLQYEFLGNEKYLPSKSPVSIIKLVDASDNSVKSGKIPTEFRITPKSSTTLKWGERFCYSVYLKNSDGATPAHLPVTMIYSSYFDLDENPLGVAQEVSKITFDQGLVVNHCEEPYVKNNYWNNLHIQFEFSGNEKYLPSKSPVTIIRFID